MATTTAESTVSQAIATTLIEGFNKHYRIFRTTSRRAKENFEAGNWLAQLKDVRDRVQFYDDRVNETVIKLCSEFNAAKLDDACWQQTKLHFIAALINHKQPELAETFFNSVTTRILHRSYFNNDYLFARAAISTEHIDSYPPVCSSYYPQQNSLRSSIRRIIEEFSWQRPFAHLSRDIRHILHAIKQHIGRWPDMEANLQIQVLYSAFYRNQSAYIIGKAINGHQEYPFALPIRHNENNKLYVDTILLDPAQISILFSLSRAYFMVDMMVPSAYVQFLCSILPHKPRNELYTMLGLGKQGKTLFFRDLSVHLSHSNDQFTIAPGIPGMVMLVFTLPSYPYVFKIIKDLFGSSKNMDRETVKRKYLMIKQVDRVGRIADSLEFSYVALPLARFHPQLLNEMHALVKSSFEIEASSLIIKHLYIERRMIPLNIYLEQADDEATNHIVREYGNAIRELATANIFPGDMLWKNFGVTRYGRVVFYDYDEIEYMIDMNFRQIPAAPFPEMEMSDEPWYAVAPRDVFPEEFATFLLSNARIRQAFLNHHRDLLTAAFWQETKHAIERGEIEEFFPYPQEYRFRNLFPGAPYRPKNAPVLPQTPDSASSS